MKLQFSLATLLVCVTVLAVVCAIAAFVPVHESRVYGMRASLSPNGIATITFIDAEFLNRSPTELEIVCRNLIWGPPSIAGILAVLWSIRRLKSRRHTEPPGG